MENTACYEKKKLRKGLWSPEEDDKLYNHIMRFGVSSWSSVPMQAGLQRCGKSSRLRWMNYLRPDLKRGKFSQQEEDVIIRMHKTLGNKWSQIAAKLPGRTDNEIKNFWNSCLEKKLMQKRMEPPSRPKEECSGNHNGINHAPIRPIFNLFPPFLFETDVAADSAKVTNTISSSAISSLSASCDFGEVLNVSNSYVLHESSSEEDSLYWSTNLPMSTSHPSIQGEAKFHELSSWQEGLNQNPDEYSGFVTSLFQDFPNGNLDAFHGELAYELDLDTV